MNSAQHSWFGPSSIPSAGVTFVLVALLLVSRFGGFGLIPLVLVAILAVALAYFPGWRRHTGTGLLAGLATLPIGLLIYVLLTVALN